MNIDGLSMHFLAKELNSKIAAAHISKISQLTNSLFVFNLRLSKQTAQAQSDLRLLIDVDKNNPAVCLTDKNLQSPAIAPNFCMFLRKYLQNGLITQVICPNFERYLVMTITAKNSYFDLVEYQLIIELMGRCSNLILVENGVIKDCLLHIDSTINRQRELLPLHPYIAPPLQAGKKSLLELENKEAITKHVLSDLTELSYKKLKDLAVNKLLGLSPLVSKSLCLEAKLDPSCLISEFMKQPEAQTKFVDCLENLSKFCQNSQGQACLYRKQTNWQNLLARPLFGCPDTKQKTFRSFSEALLTARSQFAFNSAFTQKQSKLLQSLSQQISKLANKLTTYKADIADSLDFVLDKIKGDLILANIGTLQPLNKQAKEQTELELTLTNYYQSTLPDELLSELSEYGVNQAKQTEILQALDEPEIVVKIKPNRSLALNAKNYFKIYSKKKNRLLIVRALAKDCEQNLQFYAECQINSLNADNLADLDSIENDLINFNTNNLSELKANKAEEKNTNQPGKPASGKRVLMARQREQAANLRRLAKSKQNKQTKQKSSSKQDFISFLSSDGYKILIGKNASQNDYLSLHYAKPNDIWLHLQKAPGCHILIVQKNNSQAIPDNTLKEAAQLCAWYSRSFEERKMLSNHSLASVNVDYCPASKLKKAAKAKAGLVYYNNYHTLKVSGQSAEQMGLSKVDSHEAENVN